MVEDLSGNKLGWRGITCAVTYVREKGYGENGWVSAHRVQHSASHPLFGMNVALPSDSSQCYLQFFQNFPDH